MRQMDARGRGKVYRTISWHLNQDHRQERKGPVNKGTHPNQRCATSAPLPLLDRFDLCLSGQKGLRACHCGRENDSSKSFFWGVEAFSNHMHHLFACQRITETSECCRRDQTIIGHPSLTSSSREFETRRWRLFESAVEC
ncbi:hypothetical protein CEXT_602911 [Caerostris extrusa]|uniref:Uncharacterized protein n=1 Tax=Caerostris extrusa TaxID=172846 RepID=A0AAV4U6V5_CAEEX|nr:hypothetical protein CEXT_602911 [Caerostris extrusa]